MTSNPSHTYSSILQNLATTMLGVARESVTLMKQTAPEQAMKLKQSEEWEIYLEFVKVMFNLADRLSAFYIPIQEQPQFMDSLEDAVTDRLKTILAPSLSSAEIDDMEVRLSIGQVVSESRQLYERFRFVVSEQSKEREAYFEFLGERIAAKARAMGNKQITASASLCGSAMIPAMQALFEEGAKPTPSPVAPSTSIPPQKGSATQTPDQNDVPSTQSIKLVSVMSRISGEEIETRWGVQPRFQSELKPDEAKELAQLMNRVTRILGERFAVVVASENSEHSSPTGTA